VEREAHFNPSRFIIARERRGIKKQELASKIGVTPKAISDYEKGRYEPDSLVLKKISEALRFPELFFCGDDIDTLEVDTVSFRALSKMSAVKKNIAINSGNIALLLNDWIESQFELPLVDLPDFSKESGKYSSTLKNIEPEAAAESLRNHWQLGEAPIKNMIALLESKGVRVFSLAIDSTEVDAFSTWKNEKPFIFLNTRKSAEHSRFDAAHELGHLVLHKHGTPQGREAEDEANVFASAFLMPRGGVLSTAPKFPSIANMIEYKKHWLVSLAAINYRIHALGLTSDWTYYELCKQIAKAGYRKKEPEGIQHETSQVLNKVFSALRKEGVSPQHVANQLFFDVTEINELTFGLMLTCLQGSASQTAKKTSMPKLTLVK